MVRHEIIEHIQDELEQAYKKHGREQWGRHEFYAILKEEVDELWDSIKHDEPQERVRIEALQVAAMVFRYLETNDRYRSLKDNAKITRAAEDKRGNHSPIPASEGGYYEQ